MPAHAALPMADAGVAAVLVVDDERSIRQLFVATLERAGYRALPAASGAEALEILARDRVDLVLLDRGLPEMSGDAFLRRLRSDPRTERIRVVVVSGDGAIDSKIDGLAAGANDYLVKPLATRELLARVAAQLEDRTRWQDHLDGRLASRARLSRELATLPSDLPITQLEAELRRVLAFEFSVDRLQIRPSSVLEHSRAITERSVPVGDTRERRPQVHSTIPLRARERLLATLEIVTGWGQDDVVSTVRDLAPQIASLLHAAYPVDHASMDTQRWVRAMLEEDGLRCVYQPIVSLVDRGMVGVEGLTRFIDGTAPEAAFHAARRAGVGAHLESMAMQGLLAGARALPAGCWLAVNLSATTLLSTNLDGPVASAGRPIVLEITEHEEIADYPALRARSLQLENVRFAVDDAGAGYASLRHILELQPQLVKLDRSWVAGIDTDPARQALIRGLVGFADAIAATVIGEGIERESEARTLASLGVGLGQGYLFGRPAAA